MAQMKLSRHIWRRDHNRKRLFRFIIFRLKKFPFQPPFIAAFLYRLMVVLCRHGDFVRHAATSFLLKLVFRQFLFPFQFETGCFYVRKNLFPRQNPLQNKKPPVIKGRMDYSRYHLFSNHQQPSAFSACGFSGVSGCARICLPAAIGTQSGNGLPVFYYWNKKFVRKSSSRGTFRGACLENLAAKSFPLCKAWHPLYFPCHRLFLFYFSLFIIVSKLADPRQQE